MNNFKPERKAIYLVGSVFTDFGWIFREQPIVDYGIDALVETVIDGYPSGNFIALQIKGGCKSFYTENKIITHYFSERHYLYWQSISENFPLLLIFHDSDTGLILWEHFSKDKITQTSRHWKINIPFKNVLNEEAKTKIALLAYKSLRQSSSIDKHHLPKELNKKHLSFKYFLSHGQRQLCSEIISNYGSIILNFNYKPKKKLERFKFVVGRSIFFYHYRS